MFRSLVKTTAVVVGATVLATIATNAVDMNGNLSDTMIGSVFSGSEKSDSICPKNMVLVTQALSPFCVDMYEVSAGEDCIYIDPLNEDQTMFNLSDPDCEPVSSVNKLPWRHITLDQAQRACSRAGKRLPSAGEWYKAAIGTPDPNDGWSSEHCNVSNNRAEGVSITGNGIRCISDAGAYDMVGNVWEWVEESVQKGDWNGRELPETGYITGVDVDGIAYETNKKKVETFNNDRFWVDERLLAGVMRGGYYNSKSQSGVYATYAASPPTFTGDAVGFRCVVTPVLPTSE